MHQYVSSAHAGLQQNPRCGSKIACTEMQQMKSINKSVFLTTKLHNYTYIQELNSDNHLDKGHIQPRVTSVGGPYWSQVKEKGPCFPPLPTSTPTYTIPKSEDGKEILYEWKWPLQGIIFKGPAGESPKELRQQYVEAVKRHNAKVDASYRQAANIAGVLSAGTIKGLGGMASGNTGAGPAPKGAAKGAVTGRKQHDPPAAAPVAAQPTRKSTRERKQQKPDDDE